MNAQQYSSSFFFDPFFIKPFLWLRCYLNKATGKGRGNFRKH